MSETVTRPEPPLTAKEAARRLGISYASVFRCAELVWLEYQGAGKKKIKRVTSESVQRLLEGDRA